MYFSPVCLVVTEYGQFSAFKDGLKEIEVAFAASLKSFVPCSAFPCFPMLPKTNRLMCDLVLLIIVTT